ncbi:sensor histidine kinase, partial [Nostoc sp. NIES-2111]
FYRADNSGAIPGTGLGMAIVKEIVELMGGSPQLASEPQRGTCATVRLPTTTAPAAAEAPKQGGGAGAGERKDKCRQRGSGVRRDRRLTLGAAGPIHDLGISMAPAEQASRCIHVHATFADASGSGSHLAPQACSSQSAGLTSRRRPVALTVASPVA